MSCGVVAACAGRSPRARAGRERGRRTCPVRTLMWGPACSLAFGGAPMRAAGSRRRGGRMALIGQCLCHVSRTGRATTDAHGPTDRAGTGCLWYRLRSPTDSLGPAPSMGPPRLPCCQGDLPGSGVGRGSRGGSAWVWPSGDRAPPAPRDDSPESRRDRSGRGLMRSRWTIEERDPAAERATRHGSRSGRSSSTDHPRAPVECSTPPITESG